MIIVAKIAQATGGRVRFVRLIKGANRIILQPGESLEFVDEATGRPVQGAAIGGEANIAFASAEATVVIEEANAASSGAADGPYAAASGGAGAGEAAAGAGAASGGGIGSGALLGILGGALAVGVGVAAASGGGGKSDEPTPDTTAPAAPTGLALAAADDKGSSSSDRITNITQGLTITGNAEANSTVELFNGETSLGTTTANSTGAFTLDVNLAAGATHNIMAKAKDAAGNVGAASAPLVITVDTTPPDNLTVPTISEGVINGVEAAAGVTATLGNVLSGATVTASVSGTAQNGGAPLTVELTVGNNGAIALTPDILQQFKDGTLTISARQTDVAGNASLLPGTGTVVLDRTGPTVDIKGSSDNLLAGQTSMLSFTFSEAPAGFTKDDITIVGGTIGELQATDNPLVYQAELTPNLSTSGVITVSVSSDYRDAAGNNGEADGLSLSFDAGDDGAVVDGYIANGFLFRDSNGNGAWDAERFIDNDGDGIFGIGDEDENKDGILSGEYWTVTDENGNFSKLFGTGNIILTPIVNGAGNVVTYDIALNKEFTGQFVAADGATVVSPLTTLVAAVAGANADAAAVLAAETAVKAALSLSADLDIANYDPMAAASAANNPTDLAAAINVQKAAAQIANLLAVVGATANAAGIDGGEGGASVAAATALAAVIIAGEGAPVDLTSAAVIGAVFDKVAETADNATVAAAITSNSSTVSDALANVNAAVAAVDSSDVSSALGGIAAAQIVAQTNVAAESASAVTSEKVFDPTLFSGNALADQLDGASAGVGVLIPEAPQSVSLGRPDRPVVDDGTRISGAEIANGIGVTIRFGADAGVAVGDRLTLIYGGAVLQTVVLDAAHIQTRSIALTLTEEQLGEDGTRSLEARFVSSTDVQGPLSLPLLLTIDTGTVTPIIPEVSGNFINAAEALSGVNGRLEGIEIGADVALEVTGKNAVKPGELLTQILPVTGSNFTIRPDQLARFADGSLEFTAWQTDAAGNVSPIGTQIVELDRLAESISVTAISDGAISGAEASVGVSGELEGIEPGAAVALTVSGLSAATGQAVALDVAAPGGVFTLSPSELAQFADGTLTLAAQQTDVAGNMSATANASVLLDRVADAIVFPTISGGAINEGEAAAGVSGQLQGIEDGATVSLKVRGLSAATGEALELDVAAPNGAFILSPSELAQFRDGELTLTAQQTDAVGNMSEVRQTSILLDRQGADVTSLAASEGPYITLSEAVDGTTITGSSVPGSSVAITFYSENSTFTRIATAGSEGQFALNLSAADLTVLGEGIVRFAAVATDAAGNVGPVSSPSAFYYTRTPVVDSSTRIDGAGSRLASDLDDEEYVQVSALPGGGFATHWAVDRDGDGESDTLATQRFAADGSKLGGAVLLDGISPVLAAGEEQGVSSGSINVAALADGSYALAWKIEADHQYNYYNLQASDNGVASITILGVPRTIYINDAPDDASFSLTAMGPNGVITVPLVADDGRILINEDILSQFAGTGRLSLSVQSSPNAHLSFDVRSTPLFTYNEDSPLQPFDAAALVGANGIGVLATGGRAESFDITSFTPAGGPQSAVFILQIRGINGFNYDVSEIPNAGVTPDGSITIPVSPNEDGFVAIPQSLLDQLGSRDFLAILVGINLQPDSSLAATALVREGINIPTQGVYVQSFGADGHALADAQLVNDTSSPLAPELDDEDGVQITALPNGGYVIHWATDRNGDGEGDGIAARRFGPDGTPQGPAVHFSGMSPQLINDNGGDGFANSVRVLALDGGGYAVSWATEVDYNYQTATLQTTAEGVAQIWIVGTPSVISTYGLPEGASLFLVENGSSGQVRVPLTISNDEVVITDAMLANFVTQGRYNLVIETTPNTSINLSFETRATYSYDTNADLKVVDFTTVANSDGIANVASYGRAERFDIEEATPASGQNITYILVVMGAPLGLDLSEIPGAFRQPNGQILIPYVVPDENVVIDVPAAFLEELGDQDAIIVLAALNVAPGSDFSVTMHAREPIALPAAGAFVQQFGADGQALGEAVQVDGADYPLARFNDDGGVLISAARDGGYAVHWAADLNDDGDTDTIAIQRFSAAGAKQGDVVLLNGISPNALDLDEIEIADIQLLDNGGYAVSWSASLPESYKYVPINASAQTAQIAIVGRPNVFEVHGDPGTATFFLDGTGPSGALSIPLTVVDGQIWITEDILSNFTIDDAFRLTISGVGPSLNAVGIRTHIEVAYDPSSPLTVLSQPMQAVAVAGAPTVFGNAGGRVEAFNVQSFSPETAATANYQLLIITALPREAIIGVANSVGGFPLVDGSIYIPNVTPDTNGVISVPQPLVDFLGEQDADVFLLVNGVAEGTILSATMSVREPIELPEGVFVQTFGPDGQALDSAVTANGQLINGTPDDDLLVGGAGDDLVLGGLGDDILDGGIGRDTLIGGEGEDIFILAPNGAGSLALADIIADFTVGEDKLQLSGGLSFDDLIIQQGAPGSGVSANDTIIKSASGDMLAIMLNTDAQQILQASFAG